VTACRAPPIRSLISLDALEQVQIAIAPYDVRGQLRGRRDQHKGGGNSWAQCSTTRATPITSERTPGQHLQRQDIPYRNIGIALGGRSSRTSCFLCQLRTTSRPHPEPFTANTGGQPIKAATQSRIRSRCVERLPATNFNYETGPYQGYDFKIPSTRFLARLDFNLNEHNKFNIRYNLLNSSSDQLISNSGSLGLGNRRTSLQSLNFANSNYAILENIRSIVGEWNAAFGNKSNNLILGYNTSDEPRERGSPWFPESRFYRD
jgi:hypothetical protein